MTILAKPDLTPEAEILFLCSRAIPSSADKIALEKILGSEYIDWPKLCQSAKRHGVGSMLFRQLPRHANVVPSDILDELGQHFLAVNSENLILVEELCRLTESFQKAEVTSVAFKGVALAHQLYQDQSIRRSSDLDILILEENLQQALEVLRQCGYVSVHENIGYEEFKSRVYTDLMHEHSFVHSQTNQTVDLHWRLLPNGFTNLTTAQIFAATEEIKLNGTTIRVVRPEMLLHILCGHGAKHGFDRLVWVTDIAEIMRQYGAVIDWQRVLADSGRYGSSRTVLLGTYLACTLLDAPMPEPFIAEFDKMSMHPRWITVALRPLLEIETLPQWSLTKEWLFWMALKTNLVDRLRLLFELSRCPTTTEWHQERLPDFIAPVYWQLRPAPVLLKKAFHVLTNLASVRYDSDLNRANRQQEKH